MPKQLTIDIIQAEVKDGRTWGEDFPNHFDAVLFGRPLFWLGRFRLPSGCALQKGYSDNWQPWPSSSGI